jgi:hypothetical protein
MSNVVALCVAICGFVVFTHLLRSGSLGDPTYAALLIATGLLCIAIAKIDLVERKRAFPQSPSRSRSTSIVRRSRQGGCRDSGDRRHAEVAAAVTAQVD